MPKIAEPQLTTYLDPCAADPIHYCTEYEDKHVRVLRIRYGPREKSVMHGHPRTVMVMLTDAKLRFLHPNGGSEVVEAHAGQLLEVPLGVHLPENLLDTPFEAVGVEFMYQTKPLSRSARAVN